MKFFIACLPVAQPRPKVTTINGMARMYEAKKAHPIHEFKAAVKAAWHQAGAVRLEGDIVAEMDFVFARPPKVAKKLGSQRLSKPTKPDLDNLAKGVLDSLNGLAYHDDGQVVAMSVAKCRAADGEVPGVHISLMSRSAEMESLPKIRKLF